jgi:hypothetical protein
VFPGVKLRLGDYYYTDATVRYACPPDKSICPHTDVLVTNMDEELIPDESVVIGQREDSFNETLRTVAAEKFRTQYGLDVTSDQLVVIEQSGSVAVRISASAIR